MVVAHAFGQGLTECYLLQGNIQKETDTEQGSFLYFIVYFFYNKCISFL